MRNKTIIITAFIILAIGCSTSPDRIYYPSMTVELPMSQRDIAWSRAHAFLCKNLHKPPITADVYVHPVRPDTGQYVLYVIGSLNFLTMPAVRGGLSKTNLR